MKQMDDPRILDNLAQLSDPTRARLLLVLERHELTVGELCDVLQLAQSTVSRQLKSLGDHGWLSRRPDGTRAFYSMDLSALGATERRMWLLVQDQMRATMAAEEDAVRFEAVLRERRSRSTEFFSKQAGEWDGLRRELFGARFDSLSLLGLLDASWTVADLGCGTGEVCKQLAPFVSRVIGVDRSEAMLDAARTRLSDLANVELRAGELERLPIEDGQLSAATVMLVLHHLAEPGKVVREAARVLAPGGVLLLADMMPHERDDYRQQMGHVWLGFEESWVVRQLESAGFTGVRYVPQAPDPQARGPRLFVASGRLPDAPRETQSESAEAEFPVSIPAAGGSRG